MPIVLLLNILLSLFLLKRGDPEASTINYQSEFGTNWLKAELLLEKNEEFLIARSENSGIPYREVVSIVFPELIRYSALRNQIEITLLKTLYVYKGPAYADFSVGVFQMKPSFAEKVREEVNASGDRSLMAFFPGEEFLPGEPDSRRRLISELETPCSQFRYLLAFYILCEKKFNLTETVEIPDKIRLYAAAYNCGFFNSEEYIRAKMDEKSFTLALTKRGPFYSYSDIAAFYYETSTVNIYTQGYD
jgi:hypothetical protein